MTITEVRTYVCNKAREIFFAGIATTWSEAMTLAWARIKTIQKIKAGQPVSFIKKSTGKLREVLNPAPYVVKEVNVEKISKRKPNPALIVFLDLDKEGHQTISLDIRNLVA